MLDLLNKSLNCSVVAGRAGMVKPSAKKTKRSVYAKYEEYLAQGKRYMVHITLGFVIVDSEDATSYNITPLYPKGDKTTVPKGTLVKATNNAFYSRTQGAL